MLPAHTLKGNSTTIGAMQLAELARSLEERGRRGQMDGADDDAAAAGAELDRVVAALDAARAARWASVSELAERPVEADERVAAAAETGRPRPGRVLVVDDSNVNRQTLARLLGSLGHDVVEAEDGRVALDLLGDGRRRHRRRAARPRDAGARRVRGARRHPRRTRPSRGSP